MAAQGQSLLWTQWNTSFTFELRRTTTGRKASYSFNSKTISKKTMMTLIPGRLGPLVDWVRLVRESLDAFSRMLALAPGLLISRKVQRLIPLLSS